VCRELGIGIVAYSPLGRGFLTGAITKPEDLPEDDWRLKSPRFQAEAFQKVAGFRVGGCQPEQHPKPVQADLGWHLKRIVLG